ncbi:hypothetical protein B0O80DRAFT_444751 [Mortierella sp. GBAus27b]|nr:hypothetical protein B0O80DRAFT_444751 [Mortierella sp. GBAus27b]
MRWAALRQAKQSKKQVDTKASKGRREPCRGSFLQTMHRRVFSRVLIGTISHLVFATQ